MEQREESELHEAPELNRAIVLISTHLVISKTNDTWRIGTIHFNLKIWET